jgi:hypothetical protein
VHPLLAAHRFGAAPLLLCDEPMLAAHQAMPAAHRTMRSVSMKQLEAVTDLT